MKRIIYLIKEVLGLNKIEELKVLSTIEPIEEPIEEIVIVPTVKKVTPKKPVVKAPVKKVEPKKPVMKTTVKKPVVKPPVKKKK